MTDPWTFWIANHVQGGHVNTYDDAATGESYEYGVQSYVNVGNSKAFFQRMNVSVGGPSPFAPRAARRNLHVDFTTGTAPKNYTPPQDADRMAGLRKYLAIAEQYESILEPGFWNFPPPERIPDDLLLPFRDFVQKYNLSATVPQIFSYTGFGNHDLMNTLTVWAMRSFTIDMSRSILGVNSSVVPTSRRNQDLYDRVLRFLGGDVLTSSVVTSSSRSAAGVELVVTNARGKQTAVVAKRLLVAVPPTLENLAPLAPDDDERGVFAAFNYSRSYVSVVSHPALPANVSLVNTPLAAQPDRWTAAIPAPPYIARLDHYGTPANIYRAVMVGDDSLNSVQSRSLVQDAIDRMIRAGTLVAPANATDLRVRWVAFEPHGPVSAYTTAEALRSGFIQRMTSLQGRRATWYTGAAWSAHLTTSLWKFTDTVLPKLAASLKQ